MNNRLWSLLPGRIRHFVSTGGQTRFVLWQCGLRARYVTPSRPYYPDNIGGVVIGGGDDIEPHHYGMTDDTDARHDPDRDALELKIFKFAYDRQLPVLGICRGSQLMNIALGGNLHQDLRPLRQLTTNKNTIFRNKEVVFEANSKLRQIVGQSSLRVNSMHHQAINEIAKPFRLAAKDRDGFIQAIEHPDRDFLFAVQWHPEYLPYVKDHRKLFEAFARAVKSMTKSLISQHIRG
jgi:putative glutamine amidotransferase